MPKVNKNNRSPSPIQNDKNKPRTITTYSVKSTQRSTSMSERSQFRMRWIQAGGEGRTSFMAMWSTGAAIQTYARHTRPVQWVRLTEFSFAANNVFQHSGVLAAAK